MARPMPVDQHAQQGKQFRRPLHFVDDDEPGEGLQSQLRIRQSVEVLGIFEIEVVRGAINVARKVILRQGRFAALSRT